MAVSINIIIEYLKTLVQADPVLMNTVLDAAIKKLARDTMKRNLKDKLLNDVDLLEGAVDLCRTSMPVAYYNEIKAYIEYLKGN